MDRLQTQYSPIAIIKYWGWDLRIGFEFWDAHVPF